MSVHFPDVNPVSGLTSGKQADKPNAWLHFSGMAAPAAVKSASVQEFMIHMYFTASEPMPTS